MSAGDEAKSQQEGITRISISGFKSIAEECSIDIRPLTILAGANSSGKSSIMQPLLLMKQTLEAPFDPPGAFLLRGPNVEFTSTDEILSKKVEDRRLTVEITVSGIASFTGSYREKGEHILEIAECSYRSGEQEVKLWPGMSEQDIVERLDERARHLPAALRNENGELRVRNHGCFLEPVYLMQASDPDSAIPLSKRFWIHWMYYVIRILHIPGLRGNPRRAYERTSTGLVYPGRFVNYVATLISEWQKENDERLATLCSCLRELGLTSGVKAVQKDAASIEVFVPRLRGDSSDTKDLVNIADVGFGVSQVLPVLVALLAAQPGQLVYLEQPELHLHPRAQVALAGILADAAKRGVRLVVETHSALLLLAIQTLVAEGDLPSDQVILHWFERGDDGVTRVTSREVDEKGAFGDWPEDFGDVELKLESRYLDAAEKRAMSK